MADQLTPAQIAACDVLRHLGDETRDPVVVAALAALPALALAHLRWLAGARAADLRSARRQLRDGGR